ncbi:SdpI family protein [Hominisplanchenecus murintestinalis]|uniref:SdpI family protein n=1 Tax=Hominisplanchenecus murintestinalis TaxID=2941517 RepID=UPI00203D6496|nr:SdpI family protein [Hominisplanchenecus murintestinalis]MCI8793709.1 SdpI family protein [Eubacterium sp.]
MWFWWFMFCCDILIPVTMIACGRMMWKHCPKNINGLMGYRTSRSMKNMDTWKFAHEHCGKLWWKIGWIILIPSIIVHIPFYKTDDNTIGVVGGILATVQVIILIASIFPTERALKRNFTDDGIRR